mgnify:CR=1 FL=1
MEQCAGQACSAGSLSTLLDVLPVNRRLQRMLRSTAVLPTTERRLTCSGILFGCGCCEEQLQGMLRNRGKQCTGSACMASSQSTPLGVAAVTPHGRVVAWQHRCELGWSACSCFALLGVVVLCSMPVGMLRSRGGQCTGRAYSAGSRSTLIDVAAVKGGSRAAHGCGAVLGVQWCGSTWCGCCEGWLQGMLRSRGEHAASAAAVRPLMCLL